MWVRLSTQCPHSNQPISQDTLIYNSKWLKFLIRCYRWCERSRMGYVISCFLNFLVNLRPSKWLTAGQHADFPKATTTGQKALRGKGVGEHVVVWYVRKIRSCPFVPENKLNQKHGTASCFQPQMENETLWAVSWVVVVGMKWNTVLIYLSCFGLMVNLIKHDGACCYWKRSTPWCVLLLDLFSCNSSSS